MVRCKFRNRLTHSPGPLIGIIVARDKAVCVNQPLGLEKLTMDSSVIVGGIDIDKIENFPAFSQENLISCSHKLDTMLQRDG